jgi:hypothetical protein
LSNGGSRTSCDDCREDGREKRKSALHALSFQIGETARSGRP